MHQWKYQLHVNESSHIYPLPSGGLEIFRSLLPFHFDAIFHMSSDYLQNAIIAVDKQSQDIQLGNPEKSQNAHIQTLPEYIKIEYTVSFASTEC